MNNNKRKNRPAPARGSQRGRTVPAQGIYNNSFFMHAATSIVGNLAQVQTHSGSIYEGIYRTFSANFDVAIELAQCVKPNQNQNSDVSSIANCMIFQPDHIVSIAAKNVDLDFATSGNFQTDSAISARFSGSRADEKELEPWEPSGGSINGDIDLELDGNANGWDANEMFNKNEKLYGVQSTFDQSLAGYTVQIEKKDTVDYKEAEEKAEKIAQEIENQANYHERADLENGDEEARFAAVERPPEQNPDISPRENTGSNSSSSTVASSSVMSKGTSNDKHVIPSKRKPLQGGKIRSTPPPNNNNGPIPQHSVHSSNKNNNYQPGQMQQGPPQYMINPSYTHGMHGHVPSISQAKMNGDGSMGNSNKPMPQRVMRQYSAQGAPPNSYSDSQGMGGQMSMGKQQMHISQNHSHIPGQHGNMQDASSSGHIPVHSSLPSNVPLQQSQPPPQPQRQPRNRDDVQELKKFHQDFNLVTTNQQQTQTNQVKTPSVSPHPAQTNLTPPQQVQQQLSPMQPPPQLQQQHSQPPPQQPSHSQPPLQHQVQQQHMQQPPPQPQQQQQQEQQTENITGVSTQKIPQQIQHQQDQQNYASQPPPPQQQQQQQQQQPPPQHVQQQSQQPPTIIQPVNAGISTLPPSTTPPQQQQQTQQVLNSSTSSSDTPQADKPPTIVKKTHVLNPSAKPFTPRSPSTPNPSRPHTPQTPGPVMAPNVYTTGPHMAAGQGQITYVMQSQGSFQTTPHGHAARSRLARPQVVGTSQLQVSAATGQPLLTTGPMPGPIFHYQQPPSHPSHYPSQPYQQMVRMYAEPPQPQQIQFLAQTPPSTTPSPGQQHQQFHPGQQPSPAGGAPPTYGATPQPFPVMCLATAGPTHLVPNYYQGAQTPHGQQFPLIIQPQHPSQ